VVAVGDEPSGEARCERVAGDARVAMPQRPHRVEQMGRQGRAGIDAGRGFGPGGVGMADRDADPAFDQESYEIERAR
jgi:hypothetical protein